MWRRKGSVSFCIDATFFSSNDDFYFCLTRLCKLIENFCWPVPPLTSLLAKLLNPKKKQTVYVYFYKTVQIIYFNILFAYDIILLF